MIEDAVQTDLNVVVEQKAKDATKPPLGLLRVKVDLNLDLPNRELQSPELQSLESPKPVQLVPEWRPTSGNESLPERQPRQAMG